LIEKIIKAEKLTPESFRPFGDVIGPQATKPTVSTDILSFWDLVAELRMMDAEVGCLIVKSRPFTFGKMERHVKTTEMFIPMGSCSIFPLAPASRLDDPEATPSPDEVRAFVMDGTAAVLLKEGVWHWAPFPLTDLGTYLVLLRKGTVESDLDIKDLEATKRVMFKLTL